jgi:hypothetical protein
MAALTMRSTPSLSRRGHAATRGGRRLAGAATLHTGRGDARHRRGAPRARAALRRRGRVHPLPCVCAARPAAEHALPSWRAQYAEPLYTAGRWEEAQRLFETSVAGSPGTSKPEWYLSFLAAAPPDAVDRQGYLGVLAARRRDRTTASRRTGLLPRCHSRICGVGTPTGAPESLRSWARVTAQSRCCVQRSKKGALAPRCTERWTSSRSAICRHFRNSSAPRTDCRGAFRGHASGCEAGSAAHV